MTLKSVIKCYPALKRLAKCKSPKQRKQLLNICKLCVYKAIKEIARNTVEGNIPLKSHHLKILCRHKKNIRELAKKSISLKKSKQIINQTGGGLLPALLIPAVSLLADIISRKIIK